MKRFIILSLTFLAVNTHAQQKPFMDPFAANPDKKEMKKMETVEKEKVFNVSKANASTENKELFLKLWEAVENPRFTSETRKLYFEVKQAAGKDGDLSRYLAVEFQGTRDYKAISIKDHDLIDGKLYSGWFNEDGFYEYSSIGGATRRVGQFKEAVAKPNPDAPSKEDFVTRLKAGETFTVIILDENKKCQPCFGRGKLGSLQGGGDCKDCAGKGSNEVLETWTLKW